jgi:hypothetical protein
VPLQGSTTITSSPHSFTNNFVQGCKYVNCFPVEIPQFGSDPIRVLNKAPGLDPSPTTYNVDGTGVATTWTQMGRIVQYFDQDQIFTAKGDLSSSNVYMGWITNQLKAQLLLGTDGAVSPICKVYDQAATTNNPKYFYVSVTGGGTGVNFNLVDTNAWTQVVNSYTTPLTLGTPIAIPPIYMNNRVFILDVIQGLIFNTDPINGAATYTTGSFAAPQIVADKYFGMVKYRNHLAVIGEFSIEFFYDGGVSLGSPLTRQEQYLIRHGCTRISNVVMYGDIMYFLGFTDIQGWGLYEVANFNLRKVSPPGIDAILNNIDDYTGQADPSVTINVVDVFGHAVLLFQFESITETNPVQFVFEIPKRPYGIMAPTDGMWWEWPTINSVTQGADHFRASVLGYYTFPLIFHTLPQIGGTVIALSGAYANNPASFYFTYPTNTTVSATFISKNRASSSSVTGTYITDVMDFDENNEKHVDYIDCIGDFGNNSVTLSWTNDPTYQTSSWQQASTQTQSTNGPKYAIRWHNPGPFRTIALRYDFTGTSNVVYKGTEISFNMGTK